MNLIGKPVTRLDGEEKVTGKAVFGNDLKLDGMLYAACKYSDIVTGIILSINIEAAEKIAGVKAIALYKDIPGATKVGPVRQDYLPIVKDEVFFTGDVIAVVAADTRETAIRAANAINVEYSPYEPITDPRKAASPKARLIHPEYKSNIVNHYPLRKGNIKIGFRVADRILTRTFTTGFQEHAYLEPETVTVEPDHTTGGYKIYGSIQNPYTTRKVAAMFMGLPLNRINVMPSTIGGSFGGKDDIINNIACRTALLCQMTGKPVQMTYSRENSLRESYKRHPYIMNYKVGFTHEGQIIAMKIDILADSGAYSSQSFFVTWRSVVQATGPYEIPHVETDIRSVYTNNCYTAAFRGFGSPQIIFAQESILDEIAVHCELTPLEVRLLNGFRQDSTTASGQVLSSHTVSLSQVLNAVSEKADFINKWQAHKDENLPNKRYKKGIGMACSYRGCSLGAEGIDVSSAIVSIQADGSIIIITAVSENGQGLQTTMCQIACESLGVPLADAIFLAPQTSTIADGGPTVASRGTIAGGNAVVDAAQNLKAAIFEVIKTDINTKNLKDTTWEDGMIYGKGTIKSRPSITFKAAVEKAFQAGINLSAYGWFKAPEVSWQEETGHGDAYFTYVYGCQIAEITVDSYTGKICLDQVYAAHDLGRAVNLLGVQGQIYGGVVQGFGYACTESFNISNGEVLSDNFDTYLIPTIQDVPPIIPVIIENPDKAGPYGAKSLGEPTLELMAAAINNALYNATGTSSASLPLSLEQVFLNHPLNKPARQSLVQTKTDSSTDPAAISTLSITPADLSEALNLLADKEYHLLAGGTDLIIKLRNSPAMHDLMNLNNLKELQNIDLDGDFLMIGSSCNFARIINEPLINKYFPLLAQACSLIGSTQIRNIATLGGNIVNAAPCADSLPPLIFYDAQLILQSANETRTIPVSDFIIKSYHTIIKPSEILTAIRIPLPPATHTFSHYFQLGRREALNITRLSICALIEFDSDKKISDCRIVAGSLLAKPGRLPELEEFIIGRWIDEKLYRDLKYKMNKILTPMIGKRWSAAYKIPVFNNLVIAAMADLKKQYSEYKND
ncbi:MAG: molybdopterin-dependent oxidoreductase [Candidatus Cloacimonetes bacterium]|nr:molybdopterin-dependent oxidoreductase [Candidatus Cloacimonadota bacterium]